MPLIEDDDSPALDTGRLTLWRRWRSCGANNSRPIRVVQVACPSCIFAVQLQICTEDSL